MGDKMRTTMHNGRTNSKGEVYSPKHNDRNFDVENAEHIDPLRTNENETLLFQTSDIGESATIEEHELKFYEQHFRAALDKKNENPLKHSQYARVQTMEQFIASPKSCPEETIIQIGKKGSSADRETLRQAVTEWIEWHKQQFPQAVFLDAAAHYDEPDCADHWHVRKVWIGHKDGMEVVGQNKALEEMGIERPNPNKKPSKWNNAKVTYSQICRDKWLDICQSHGLEIETEPLETSRTGLTHTEYKRRQEEEKAAAAKQEQQATLESIDKLTDTVLSTIKPEKVGLLQHKTGNFVMNEQTYQEVMTACEEIKRVSRQIAETATATEQDRTAAAEERRQAELSRTAEQQRIQQLVRQELEEQHKQELEDRAAAAADRAKAAEDRATAERLVKQQKAIMTREIKKGIETAVQGMTAETTQKAMGAYFKGKQLADGRNALQAFQQDHAAAIERRLKGLSSPETQEQQYESPSYPKF